MDSKPDLSKNLDAIYRDIIGIEVKITDSFETLLNKFYEVMRKWGIKQGTWSEEGNGNRTMINAEWNMCWQVFRAHKILEYDIWLILHEPPDDLLAYGEKPIKK